MKNFTRFKQILRTSVPLAMHTWLQLGGQVEYFAEPRSEEELADLLQTGWQRDAGKSAVTEGIRPDGRNRIRQR